MPRGTDIKIDTIKMRSVAKVIENQMNIVKSCFDSIRKDACDLTVSDYWQGESANAYYDNMKQLCYEVPLSGALTAGQILETLRQYVIKLNNAANNFDRNEKKLTSKNEGLPSNIFDV